MVFLHRFVPAVLLATAALAVSPIGRACSGSLHIELQHAGVYALDYAAIAAKQPGLADCRSSELALSLDGHEVPIRIAGDRDGKFAAGARVEWIGKPLHGPVSWFDPFSSFNAYILGASAGMHLRMHEFATAAPGKRAAALVRRVHLERQKLLVRLDQQTMKPGDEPDVWLWAKLTHIDQKPFALEFDLPDLARNARTGTSATADLRFRGMSSVPKRAGERVRPSDHVVELTLNGHALAPLDWNGRDEIHKQVKLPIAWLRAKGNTLDLRVPARHRKSDDTTALVDVVMFDAADLTYPIAGDLDASSTPLETADSSTPAAVTLAYSGHDPVAFYSSAGEYRAGARAAGGRYRLAAAKPGVEIYPVAGAQFRQPTLLRAVAAQDLRDASPGYDYLIVSYPSLIDAVRPLAEFHRKQGLRVDLVNVDDIYDQFNGGVVHPSAIRDFIAWGHSHWRVKPRYVLLVGTASFDLRHSADPSYNESQVLDPRTGSGKVKRADTAALAKLPHPDEIRPDRNLIPTWQFPSPEGQSASDNAYVALKKGDFHPTLAIGRFPVVTSAEVAAIVKKTIDYESKPAAGAWRSKVMFITNESDYFHQASDQIAKDIEGQGFTAEKIYASAKEKDNLAHQADIKSSLDAGSLLVHFLGHGGRFIWRSGPPDFRKNHDLFTLADVSELDNANRLPMVLSMTCYSGSFDNPNSDTIGERFLRTPDKGAVAVFAASWRNSPSPMYSKSLVDELLKPGQRIGDAIVAAKAKNNDRVLVETYNLFGDPAVVLDRPRGEIAMARSADRWHQRVAVRLPQPAFDGKVTVDWIDADGTTIGSRVYTTSDRAFELPIPSSPIPSDRIAQVNVYAADARSGRGAMGHLDLRPPPVKVAAAKPAPRQAGQVTTPVAAVAPRPALPSNRPDPISRFDFEGPGAATSASASSKTSKASGLDTAVAVDPGRGKREPQQ